MAAMSRHGIYLGKPYRMVDLDHCLQRSLAAAKAPPGSRSGKPQVGSAPQIRLRGSTKADDAGDEGSGRWVVELSRQLAERATRQQSGDPDTAKAARSAALAFYDRGRRRKLRLLLGIALGAVLGSAIAILGSMVALKPVAPSAARTKPAPSIAMMTGHSASLPADRTASSTPSSPLSPLSPLSPSTPSSTVADTQPAPVRADPTPPPRQAEPPASAEPESGQPPLGREEVREVQARLRSFGFNPGPIDGAVGAMTTAAVMRYQQARGRWQTGTVDRELLAQLREDAAPKPAPHALTRSLPAPRPDPFKSVRTAGDRLGRWLDSWLR